MATRHWFLVASQKEARIFVDGSDRRKRLELLKSIQNPLGQVKSRDLLKTKTGRGVRMVGHQGTVHFLESRGRDPKEDALAQFAKKIAEHLAAELQRKQFSSLTVAAEPHLLGKLKAEMGNAVERSVICWVRKDFQKTPIRELAETLLEESKESRR